MPGQAGGNLITLPASADLSASQFCAVKVDSNGQVALAQGNAAIPDQIIGILQNKPAAAGRPAVIQTNGVSKAKAGGALATIGVKVSSTAAGELVAAVTTDIIVGVLLTAAGSRCRLSGVRCWWRSRPIRHDARWIRQSDRYTIK